VCEVSIVSIGYGPDWSRVSILGKGKRFFSSQEHSEQFWGPSSLLYSGYPGFLLGRKRPGREAGHSPQSTVEVNNGASTPPLPHTSPWRGALLIKRREIFNLVESIGGSTGIKI
jgi:hypothetical protein